MTIELDEWVFIDNSVIDKWVAARFKTMALYVPTKTGVDVVHSPQPLTDFRDACGHVTDMQRRNGAMYCHVIWDNVKLPSMWLRREILQRV